MAVSSEDNEIKVDYCQAAEEFAILYFKTMDVSRQKLAKLYMDDARLVWNGNSVDGNEAIAAFYANLPISESTLHCLDAQLVSDEVNSQPSIVVFVVGVVKFEGKSPAAFHESFVLTLLKDVWYVVTDCFRFQ